VMARDVTLFYLEFYDEENDEWLEEWGHTNQIPKVVKIGLGLGKSAKHTSDPADLSISVVDIPSYAVQADIQGGGGFPAGLQQGVGGGGPGGMSGGRGTQRGRRGNTQDGQNNPPGGRGTFRGGSTGNRR